MQPTLQDIVDKLPQLSSAQEDRESGHSTPSSMKGMFVSTFSVTGAISKRRHSKQSLKLNEKMYKSVGLPQSKPQSEGQQSSLDYHPSQFKTDLKIDKTPTPNRSFDGRTPVDSRHMAASVTGFKYYKDKAVQRTPNQIDAST